MAPTMLDATPALMEPTTTTVRRCGRRPPPEALPNALSDANANAAAAAAARRPKTKSVASRYLTPASKSFPNSTSVSVSSTAKSPPAPKTTLGSTDRPRGPMQPSSAVATDAAAATSGATTTTTTRTLAVAFQTPTYSYETSSCRTSSAEPASVTPELKTKRPTSAATRAKVSDASQNTYRWPPSTPPVSEFSASSKKRETQTIAAGIFGAARSTAAFPPRRASVDGAAANDYLLSLSSDTDDSASSGGSGDVAPRRSVGSRPSPRNNAMSSSARFARDAMGARSERFVASPVMMPSPSPSPAPKPVKKRSLFTGLLSSSPFSRASSLKQQPSLSLAPTSKPVAASAFRRAAAGASSSPAPARRSTDEGPAAASAGNMKVNRNSSSAGCYGGVDGGDVKVLKLPAAVRAEEEHQLRLLYTRELQWRLVNAQAAAAGSSQTMGAEKNLCGAWISILRVRKSVAIRKMQLQLLRNSCKLVAILSGHMKYLEEWSFLETDHAHSLSGIIEALTATVLRLPVSNEAMADIQGIRNVLSSAVDIMHTIRNSTSTQLPKLARTNVLASQLARVFIQEHILISQCRDLLSTLASMHVTYSSLQGQRIQLNQRRRQ